MPAALDDRGQLHAVSMAILRLARPGVSRAAFARAACGVILDYSGCEAIELWLDDAALRYRVMANRGAEADSQTRFVREATGEADRRRPLMEHLAENEAGLVLREGRLTPGGSFVHAQELVEPSAEKIWRAVIPFHVGDGHEGALLLHSRAGESPFGERIARCEELAQLVGLAVAHRRAHAALTERVKELTCMYQIARVSENPNLSREQLLVAIVELLPPAWQFPDLASARIQLDGSDYTSVGFRPGTQRLSADVVVRGQRRGFVEVVYLEDGETEGRGATLPEELFLPEEHSLVRGVARELSLIIERAHLQEQIRHADRLATIGQLAAGVAHELNEPLCNILGFAQLAVKDPALPSQPRADLDRIVQAGLFAREVIRKLMLFARQTPSTTRAVNLNRVIEEGLYFLEARCAKEGVEVQLDLVPDLPDVRGDFSQLQQVLVNLVVNSIQAMPNGGTLSVRTYAAGRDVCLEVRDSGVGIDDELQRRMFLPFVTTKEVGEGTGLGLSVVHGIVTSHGGEVRVASQVGEGSRFEVRLPVELSEGAEDER